MKHFCNDFHKIEKNYYPGKISSVQFKEYRRTQVPAYVHAHVYKGTKMEMIPIPESVPWTLPVNPHPT